MRLLAPFKYWRSRIIADGRVIGWAGSNCPIKHAGSPSPCPLPKGEGLQHTLKMALKDYLTIFTNRRVGVVLLLGFASGLPLALSASPGVMT